MRSTCVPKIIKIGAEFVKWRGEHSYIYIYIVSDIDSAARFFLGGSPGTPSVGMPTGGGSNKIITKGYLDQFAFFG